jgi:hypothetical protein
MIGAGVNAKALSTYMGHASVTLTLDRYGHMFPGNESEAAGLLDAYLERATALPREGEAAAQPLVWTTADRRGEGRATEGGDGKSLA